MKNSKFMMKINRLPPGTKLVRERYGKHGSHRWVGTTTTKDSEEVGPVRNPNLGTVIENLLILKRRQENGGEENN